ncbi:MAG TPA: CBS domain-containing protein [Stellaceae bacterium]|nr:CBS domain-containing protein [Stellaceae bacterium]
MTTDVVTVLPEEPLENAVRLMEQRRIKRLPVVDDGRLVGIVSRADLVRALLRLLKAEPSQKPGDDEIQQSIMAEIDRQRWAPRAMLTVDVSNGVVDLSGCITDERERTALCVLVENVPGVVAVRDHLTWIDPVSGMVIGGDEEAR